MLNSQYIYIWIYFLNFAQATLIDKLIDTSICHEIKAKDWPKMLKNLRKK